ncbi:MAG: hypothetical protein BGO26_16690 [Actinobacteria bacterium 69-20]|nr:NTP-binding protein [Actinomycetota bacterium]OJV27110.1 MAG: hypothetical protein BGO26_16690 [Actinobacteria bacterium 69-20]
MTATVTEIPTAATTTAPDNVLPPPTAPMAVARVILREHLDADAVQTLRHYRGGWVRWTGAHWADVEDRQIRADLYKRVEHALFVDEKSSEPKGWNPTARRVSDLSDALAAATHLHEDIDAPAWLSRTASDPPARETVACTNGLLHVPTRTLNPATPRYFTRVSVPFAYDPAPPEPRQWLRFLAQLWPDDPDAIRLLQEYVGYVLSGRTDMHKILLLIGPTRSGKGTISRVVTELIGAGNVVGPTLASLGTNFGLAPLLGKSLAIVADARLGGRDTRATVERLLSISGEDALTIDRKYRDTWTGRLPVRFMIASNELPQFGDASGAVVNRFLVLTMARSFLGHEDHRLTDKLLTELPGILHWALDGLARLVENRAFTIPASSDDAITGLMDMASPVESFLRERTAPGGEVTVTDLYAAWKAWCDLNGREHPGTAATLGRDLRSCRPTVKTIQPRIDGTKRERAYSGLHLIGTAHNAPDRVPPRASDPEDDPARDGTRENPLLPLPDRACERCGAEVPPHHVLCSDCTAALMADARAEL